MDHVVRDLGDSWVFKTVGPIGATNGKYSAFVALERAHYGVPERETSPIFCGVSPS